MVARDTGAIINVASVVSFLLPAGSVGYASTKSWLHVLSEGIYLELRVTAVILAALLVGSTFLIITMAGLQEARQRAPRAPTHLLSRMTAAFALGQIAAPALVSFVPGQAAAAALNFCLRLAAVCLVATALILWRMPAARDPSA
jgi:NAD(P)-dependent dehydrogenase (short-subunit alcohol dehydrogenase family)